MLKRLINWVYNIAFQAAADYQLTVPRNREAYLRKNFDIHKEAKLGNPMEISMLGNISIGANSYVNSGNIHAGAKSKIIIGDWCAIGYNVNIIAKTHDKNNPTGLLSEREEPEEDIIIGNHVWIGTNVFIKEGIQVGDHAIIGANAMVTKNVSAYEIVGGVPAKVIGTSIRKV